MVVGVESRLVRSCGHVLSPPMGGHVSVLIMAVFCGLRRRCARPCPIRHCVRLPCAILLCRHVTYIPCCRRSPVAAIDRESKELAKEAPPPPRGKRWKLP